MECQPTSGVSVSGSEEQGLIICIFSKFLGDAGDTGPGTSLRTTALEEGPESIV